MVYTLSDGTQMTRRKKVILTGAASGVLTDHQLELATTYADAMQVDFDDVRFTKADMQTLIDAWLESKVDSTSANIWVEFLTTPADGVEETEAYMYFGNVGAASDWDIEATFLFGDDFNAALDSNKWTTVQGAITTSGGELQVLGTSGTRGLIEQNTTNYPAIPIGAALESQSYSTVIVGSSHFATMRKAGDWSHRVDIFGDDTNDDIIIYSGDGVAYDSTDVDNVGLTSSHKWTVEWYSGNAKYYKDGGLLAAHTTRAPSDALVATFYEGNAAGRNSYIDYMFIRKFVTNPPTYEFGSEEHQRRTPMMM